MRKKGLKILDRFMLKLKLSGYNQSQRQEALFGGLKRYRKGQKGINRVKNLNKTQSP